ncbi:hypothetical protein UFOVP393_41 [uncultured Caudovirales phage]|uniref:Terminase small subunit n=1 Tax=uncultured Caudovirales phage TaxID=2100421 RepID=A0A6J7X4I2_9CAUD|nr:hypothetical protein UFOVP393_41 [uncultured Caudovirales phage]
MADSSDDKNSKPVNKVVRLPNKLSRQQIKEGLNQFPVEVLLSAGPNKKAQLTHKQREFARQLALGKTKVQAYRDSRDTQGSPTTQGNHASQLAKDARIQNEVEAYKLAIEAEKHRTPAQLKSLLVQQLVQHSLDSDFPPAQRVQCLKLLGSLFEVGAFVERKEVTTVSKSGDIRARVLDALKDVTDITTIDDGLSLLDEIKHSQAGGDAHISPPNTGDGVQKHGKTPDDDVDDVILNDDVGVSSSDDDGIGSSSSSASDGSDFSGQDGDPTRGAPA